MIGGHHLKAQDLVTPRAKEYARKTRFKHKQGHVWKIAWSIEDLKTHGFGKHLMGHDLVIFIKGAITMEPADASAILDKLEAITRQWEVINERVDHMGVPREKVGYPDTCQDKDRTQAQVDPLYDEIDSPRENDLYPSGASTYNFTKGEQNDQPSVDDIDLLEYLENPSCDCLCEDDFDCGPLASRDGLYVCEDNSCEREGDMCLEIPSTSSLCVSYVGHIPRGNFETSSKCMHGNTLFEVDLWNSFLNPLLVHDIFNSDKEDLPNFEDDTLGLSLRSYWKGPWIKKKKEAKKCKRLADEFYELHASKEITASSKWEDCKSLLGDRQVASFSFIDLKLVTRLQGPLENDN
ncbi:hypothetical protein CQW23_29195 [Capsicum baccatum]|uniref:Uncharacterized protein n=1 Tax=Capsicum baccatum TaxID=33114 RepID=A0A2G2VIS4_CAPBA|nr:hypothetical protein CQW23_29195 [Capsicum baccatum]